MNPILRMSFSLREICRDAIAYSRPSARHESSGTSSWGYLALTSCRQPRCRPRAQGLQVASTGQTAPRSQAH
jgi:hypothetical protein